VIEGLAFDCRTNQEEIFGPVVTLTPFDSEEEVLMMANSTEYGLACTIFTENLNKAHRVAKEVHTGIVWINDWLVRDLRTPFGGMKNSGVGREGGFERNLKTFALTITSHILFSQLEGNVYDQNFFNRKSRKQETSPEGNILKNHKPVD
jgi:acyl-CoA reductase-like NAD-dependent aldehyde dehydrogenase